MRRSGQVQLDHAGHQVKQQHWFVERLEEFGTGCAIVWKGTTCTYQELAKRIGEWSDVLEKRGVKPGDCVAFFGDPSPNTCALMFALTANGNIVVPLSSAAAGNQEDLLKLAQVQAVFDVQLHDRWEFRSLEVEGSPHPLLVQLREAGRPGLVLFSSGSTGVSKGVVHDLDLLLQKYQRRGRTIRALVFLLLDHIGGINTLLHILANGGTAVAVEDRSPETICTLVESHKIEVLPTTPTFLTMLLMSEVHKNRDLSSLKLITYGTEPMPQSTLRELGRVFPGVTLKQTYGMTELGILSTKSMDSTTLWMKLGGDGVETKVVDGKLWIRSRTPMLGYLNAPSPFDADGWYNTEDEVEVQGEYLRVLGRASDIVNVGGEKVYPAEVEDVLLALDNVREATVRGKRNPITGNVVAAAVSLCQPEDLTALKRRIRDHCVQLKLPRFKIPVVVEIVSDGEQRTERYKKLRRAKRDVA